MVAEWKEWENLLCCKLRQCTDFFKMYTSIQVRPDKYGSLNWPVLSFYIFVAFGSQGKRDAKEIAPISLAKDFITDRYATTQRFSEEAKVNSLPTADLRSTLWRSW